MDELPDFLLIYPKVLEKSAFICQLFEEMEHAEFNKQASETHLKLGVGKMLKVCPVCDALNSADQEECFICSWHNAFDHDESRVNEALDELILRCPSFGDVTEPRPLPVRDRLKLMMLRIRGYRPIDTTA